jgi:Na+-translocating ferredoxin:NAD+ oxidoreductase RnfG subunit
MFTEDPVKGGIIYKENGVIDIPEVPGLGAKIEERYLNKAERIILN